ncbi:MAG: hypothetical protein QOD98_898 [Nocardioidaceae bacterium]|nr:hypothetical protein [Nocardioidaceae bacterium]
MTELHHQAQVEGWHEDPYGRHEMRFFDGQRWTPYVRDGAQNGLDEPLGPAREAATRSPLLDEDLLVVERFTDLGRRWSDRKVLRPDGTQAGMLRRAAPAVARPSPGLRSIVARDETKNDVVELVDDKHAVVLTLIRPVGVPKSWVEVRDSEGREAGRIVQQSLRRNETTYAFLSPHGNFLGDLQTDNWVAWDLRIMDSHTRQVATITRDWAGLDMKKFSRPDDYVVRIRETVHEPLRTLVVACALSLEIAIRPDTRGA